MPGVPELLVILVIVLLIFGAGKLPAIGDALGRSIKNFRRASAGADEIEVNQKKELPAKKKPAELEDGDDIADADVVDSKQKVAASQDS